jgi:hypothetical protein
MLDLEFMRLAFAVGIVVGVLAPAVGFFLVERKQSLVGDGLGHVAFAGVAAGYLLGISPVLTALCFAVVGAVASTPVVGSSSARHAGSAARARAMKARCCIPTESGRRGAPARSPRPTRSIACSTAR